MCINTFLKPHITAFIIIGSIKHANVFDSEKKYKYLLLKTLNLYLT